MSHDLSNNPELKDGDFDYAEPHNVSALHSSLPENPGPDGAGAEPIKLWYIGVVAILLFIGGFYLALFSGGFRPDVFSIGGAGSKGVGAGEGPKLSLIQIGGKVYKAKCVACHGEAGMGAAGVYPPLAGSDYVVGSDERLAAILLNGIKGPLKVGGITYNGQMEPLGRDMNDEKLAGLLTYIRSAWGNAASEIQPDQIKVAREKYKDRTDYFTEAELLAITSMLPPSAAGGAAAPAPGSEGAPAAAQAPAPATP